jgi:hypothetical protein
MSEQESIVTAPKRTPREHALSAGLIKPGALVIGGKQTDAFSAEYNAADVIHGWGAQERATGQAPSLSVAEFEAAIEAGNNPDETTGEYTPHAPACTDYSPLKK